MKRIALLLTLLCSIAVAQPPAQQVINIGTSPNSGNGDPLRTAFTKTNTNVAALFNMFGPSSNLATSGSALATDLAALFTGCGPSAPALGYLGACVAGGGGGGGGTVTSITVSPPAGFLVTPTTITTTGTFVWSGALAVSAGGTGATSPAAAMQNLLPKYVSGNCLSNSGSALLWVACGGAGAVSSVTAGISGLLQASPTTGAVVVDVAQVPGYTVQGNGTNSTSYPVAETMPQLQAALVAVNTTLISPTVAAGPINDWSATGWGANVGRICATPASGGSVLNGWLAGSDGQTVELINCEGAGGADLIRLANQNTGSSAANRFADPGDIIIYAGADAICIYTAGTTNRWHCH